MKTQLITFSLTLFLLSIVVGCTTETASNTADPKKTETMAPQPDDGPASASEPAQPKAPEIDPADLLRHEDLDGTLWIQTSGEYAAITRQAYAAAATSLGDALVDPTWTASLEQKEMVAAGEVDIAKLPPAVILDVDETCLDNSKYQVSLIENRTDYTRESWKAFCKSKTSEAIPGCVDFVNRCRAAGVNVIFLTNREKEVEPETRENMIAVGLVANDDPDNIYTKYEQEDWKSDKITRRKHLASKYRILLLIGDDLHDFASTGKKPASNERREFANTNADMWGKHWIVLPNPSYGGWEQSSVDWKSSSSQQTKLELKIKKLKR